MTRRLSPGQCCCGPCGYTYYSPELANPFEDPGDPGELNPAYWELDEGAFTVDDSAFEKLTIDATDTRILSLVPAKKSSCRFEVRGRTYGAADMVRFFIGDFEEGNFYEVQYEAVEDFPAISIWEWTEGVRAGSPIRRKENEIAAYDPAHPTVYSDFELRVSFCRNILLAQVIAAGIELDESGDHPDNDNLTGVTYRPLMISIGNEAGLEISPGVFDPGIELDGNQWAIGGSPSGTHFSITEVAAVNTDRASDDAVCHPDTACEASGLLTEMPMEITQTMTGMATDIESDEQCECNCESLDGSYSALYSPHIPPPTPAIRCQFMTTNNEACAPPETCTVVGAFATPGRLDHYSIGGQRYIRFTPPHGGAVSVNYAYLFPVPRFWRPADVVDEPAIYEEGTGEPNYCRADELVYLLDQFNYEVNDI